MGNAESNIESKKENEKNNPQDKPSNELNKNSSNQELNYPNNQLETPNPVSYENTFNSNFRLNNDAGEPKMANATASSAGNRGFGLSRSSNIFLNDKRYENQLEQENGEPLEKKSEPINIHDDPTPGNSQGNLNNVNFLKNIKSTKIKNLSSNELESIEEKENETKENERKEKTNLLKISDEDKNFLSRQGGSIRKSLENFDKITSQFESEENNKSQNKSEISHNSLQQSEDSFEIFKPKRKEFMVNDFSNLENYVLLDKPEYLLKDIVQYEKNLEEEVKKISTLHENIFILNDGTKIKDKIFKQIKDEVARQNTYFNKQSTQYNIEQLDKLDIEADDFYRELASRVNMAQKRAFTYKDKLFSGSNN
jgi:hypothetical protein